VLCLATFPVNGSYIIWFISGEEVKYRVHTNVVPWNKKRRDTKNTLYLLMYAFWRDVQSLNGLSTNQSQGYHLWKYAKKQNGTTEMLLLFNYAHWKWIII